MTPYNLPIVPVDFYDPPDYDDDAGETDELGNTPARDYLRAADEDDA